MSEYIVKMFCFIGLIGICLLFVSSKHPNALNENFILALMFFGVMGMFFNSADLLIEFCSWVVRSIKGN